jgi:hypothetical protein
MSELLAKYNVLLRSDIPAREFQLLLKHCSPVADADGKPMLHFWCTEIDTSHHYYLQISTFKAGDTVAYPVQIPHHLVLLISGAQRANSIGFTTALP